MLVSRILKAEPAVNEANVLKLLERGPIDRKDLFVHFKATYPDKEPNVDGIRGGNLDQMLKRLERARTICLIRIEGSRAATHGSAASRTRVLVSLSPPPAIKEAPRSSLAPDDAGLLPFPLPGPSATDAPDA
jgi:hypothetical protein